MLENFLQSEIYQYISLGLILIASLIFIWIVIKVDLLKKPVFAGAGITTILLVLIPDVIPIHPIWAIALGIGIIILGYLIIGCFWAVYYATHSD